MARLLHRLSTVVMVILAAVAGYAGYRVARSQVAEQVYLARLGELKGEYDALQTRYNEAVRKTAVTELLVEDGKLCVTIRDASGAVQTLPTPFDPSREIFVDYVVVDGRLWIRRVFDDKTPPEQAMVIDPKLARVDWDSAGAAHGKAAYRTLSEGRWLVTVTGDGAVALAKCDDCGELQLATAPPVKDYETLERDTTDAVQAIGVTDVVRHLTGG